MTPRPDTAWMILVFLMSLRVGALLLVAPGFGTLQMPVQFRVLLTIGLSVALATALGATAPLPGTTLGLLATSLGEIAVGGLLGFGMAAAFGAFAVAGRAMDLQIGFGVANLIDPTTRTQSPQMGTLLNLFALAVFFGVGGHHVLLRGLAASFERIPPGAGLADAGPGVLAAQFGIAFSMGLALAAPVLVLLLLIDLGLAVMSRAMPQMNVYFVALPLKIFAGILMLALSLPHLGPVMARIFSSIFRFWEAVGP
jgi:flagellar biosynthesis protein FliR